MIPCYSSEVDHYSNLWLLFETEYVVLYFHQIISKLLFHNQIPNHKNTVLHPMGGHGDPPLRNQRNLNEINARMLAINEIIQKRTMILFSAQPLSS